MLINKVHRHRSDILKSAEQWCLLSLATADDFQEAILQNKVIQTCKNILTYKPPLESNTNGTVQLLQAFRRNVEPLPQNVRLDFLIVVNEFLVAVDSPDLVISPSAITIVLGALYQEQPMARPPTDEFATLAQASQPFPVEPTPRSQSL